MATLFSPRGRRHGSLASQTVTSSCAAGGGSEIRFAARRRPARSVEPSTSKGGSDSHSHIAQGCRRCPPANHQAHRAPQRQLMQGTTVSPTSGREARDQVNQPHGHLPVVLPSGVQEGGFVLYCVSATGAYMHSCARAIWKPLLQSKCVNRSWSDGAGAGRLRYRLWQRYTRARVIVVVVHRGLASSH